MQIKAVLRKTLTANMRQKLAALSAAFIVYVVLLAGIFSYFYSKDTVTNRISSKTGSVTVREPKWDSSGKKMAQASEPGMNIPKDPSGMNNGQTDEYIRLKMTVSLEDFNATGKTDSYKSEYNYTSDKRLRPIIEAIKLVNNNTETPFLTLDAAGSVSEWTVTSNNTDFYTDGNNHSGNNDELVFYFYYKADNNDGKLSAVRPGEATSELFQQIDIPVFKKDYLGVFDQEYSITIQAQGLPSGYYPDGLSAADAPAEFLKEE